MTTNLRECSCKGPGADSAFCGACVKRLLHNALRHQEEARQERERQGQICQTLLEQEERKRKRDITHVISSISAQTILNDPDVNLTEDDFVNPARLKAEADGLRSIITKLTQKCNATAVERDKLAVINSVRAAKVQEDESRLDFLCDTMERVYLDKDGGILPVMQNSVNDTLLWNRRIRIQLALKIFEMHRLDVGSDNQISPITNDNNQKFKSSEVRDNSDIDKPINGTNQRLEKMVNIRPRGVGKICGLPMPHAGSVLFGAMPPSVLTSALRFIASLTYCLGRTLSVPLPHPIDLRPPPSVPEEDDVLNGDISHLPNMDNTHEWGGSSNQNNSKYQTKSPTHSRIRGALSGHLHSSVDGSENTVNAPASSSTSGWSIRRTLAGAASTAMSRVVSSSTATTSSPNNTSTSRHNYLHVNAKGENHGTVTGSKVLFTEEAIQDRIRYATAAVIRESASVPSGSRCILATSYCLKVADAASLQEDEFNTGLQLLQNDVVAVCINAGVPISALWPAEAMLLNLNALRLFCLGAVKDPP